MRLTIAQIENPRPDKLARTLDLDGSLAPIDSLGYGVEQRVEIEFMPGSRVPAIQMSGAEYDPTEIRFSWKGKRFAVGEATLDGRNIGSIDELVDVMTSFVEDTALVEIGWRGRNRKAVIQAFKPEEGSLAEADAVLTVAWVEGPAEVLRIEPETRPQPRSLFDQLDAALESGIDTAMQPVTWARGVVDATGTAIARVRASVYRVKVAADSVTNLKQSIEGAAQSAANAISEIFTTTAEVMEALELPPAWIAQTDEAGQQIQAAVWRARQRRAASRVRYTAALERRNYRPESAILAVYTGVEGDTIWSVSRRFYGDPRRGPDIARWNNLISAHLRPGQRIEIPALRGAA